MKERAKALISRGFQAGRTMGVALLSDGLRDEREEMFVILVCDGLPMGLAFKRAGFTSKDHNAPHALMALPRVQERAAAILEARRTTGVVSLPEVTSMLQRVFAGAHSEGEYSAAHNAAFSLARLYGHVTDKATLEVIRRPSRDPDAPSEQALEAWAASLPVVGSDPSGGPSHGAPAPLLENFLDVTAPAVMLSADNIACYPAATPDTHSTEKPQQYQAPDGDTPMLAQHVGDDRRVDWLGEGPGEIGNGAPTRPVTGTPDTCGQSPLLGGCGPSPLLGGCGPSPLLGPDGCGRSPLLEKGAPAATRKVPIPPGGWPKIEDLF